MNATGSIERVRLCAEADVPPREGKVVRVGDRPLAVFNTDEGFRVIDNTCTHMGGTLADGLVSDATVACPLHDRRFELATGRGVGHDCGSVAAYPVEVDDGAVYALVPVFDLGDGRAAVAGGVADDEVTAPVELEERGEGPQGDDAQDPPSGDAVAERETTDEGERPSGEAERPIDAKAGLREPAGDKS